jgi:hypothetical protein
MITSRPLLLCHADAARFTACACGSRKAQYAKVVQVRSAGRGGSQRERDESVMQRACRSVKTAPKPARMHDDRRLV